MLVSEIDSLYHLWTIQDAKDGDVLYSPSHRLIWIYKDNEHYYACLNMNYVTENTAIDGLIKIPSDACPATKEQRDALMKAMAYTGYTFDFEKKELKKIEQKPTDKVEPKFKVKYAGSEYNVLEVKHTSGVTYYGIEDEPNHIDYVKVENREIISGYAIKENGSPYPIKPAVFSEQKPAWSEDDETNLRRTEYAVMKFFGGDCSLVGWLRKSLKERYTWKPSDEQIEALEYSLGDYNIKIFEDRYKILKSLYNDLKKLKG